MNWIICDYHNLLLIFCGLFYSVLCVFSIVTGLMYASGKRELNPLELSSKTVAKLDTAGKKDRFARKMGWVTFWVGIVQGITAFSILKGYSPVFYFIAAGFTVFSILSVSFKLKSRISSFALMKSVFYAAILIILLLGSSRALFF